jgi:hypothetical protein
MWLGYSIKRGCKLGLSVIPNLKPFSLLTRYTKKSKKPKGGLRDIKTEVYTSI